MTIPRLLSFSSSALIRVSEVSLPKHPRSQTSQRAMLAVFVPRNGVPKNTIPAVDLKIPLYFLSRDALSSALKRAYC